METFKTTIHGVNKILMHNGLLADPLDPRSIELGKMTSKKKKTFDDHFEISRLEWFGGLYLDDAGEPAIPVDMVLAMVIEGAKKSRNGPVAKAGIFPSDQDWFPLVYDGPRDPKELWEEKRYVDRRMVVVDRKRIARTRPCFANWELTIELTFDPQVINRDTVAKSIEDAGQLVGIGDMRPRFGRFVVEG